MSQERSTWPNGKRSAAVLSFDFDAEEVWIGENPANARRPGVLSQGTYGAKVGVPLILDLLRQAGVTATFFIPGRDAQRHPDAVRAILADGHEVGHHGFTHTSPAELTEDEEEAELTTGLEVLRGLGADPVGYRSPSWDFSEHTLTLLTKHGLQYSSNLMDDLRPYQHPEHPLVELPVQWILDDAAYWWFDGASWTKSIRLPSEVLESWQQEIAGIHALGGLSMVTMHPMLSGRPSRLAMLKTFIDWLVEQDDIWLTTARAVADHVNAVRHLTHDGA